MKNVILFFCFILGTQFFLQNEIYPQWIHTGPDGGWINTVMIDGTNVFVGALSGAYRSTDNGTSWTGISDGFQYSVVTAFIKSEGYLFVGTDGGGVYRSTNDGTNWLEVNTGIPIGTKVTSFATMGSTLFMGVTVSPGSSAAGVWRSIDNGGSWTQINNGLTTPIDIRSLAVNSSGTSIFAGTFTKKVFKSTDNGENWILSSTGLGANTGQALAVSGTNIFTCGRTTGAYRSTDDGLNWTAINNGLPTTKKIRNFAVSGTNVFAVDEDAGVFITTDNGANWTLTGAGLAGGFNLAEVATSGSDIFVTAHFAGVFYSGDLGATWAEANNGIASQYIEDMASIGSTLFAATDLGVYRSTDDGLNWIPINNGLDASDAIMSLAVHGTDLLACGFSSGVYKSTNNGDTWASMGLVGSNLRSISVVDSVLYAGGFFPFPAGSLSYRSTDNGATWLQMNDLNTFWLFNVVGNDQYVFGATFDGVFRSTDDGATWTAANTGLVSTKISNIVFTPGYVFAATGEQNGGVPADGVYRSSDNGDNWIAVNTGLPSGAVCWGFEVSGENLFVSTSSVLTWHVEDQIFRTTNNGDTWEPVSTGLVAPYVQGLYIYGDYMFAYTYGSSVWRRLLDEIIPVELITFNASVINNKVNLFWSTATELNNQGFEVERASSLTSPSQEDWEKIGYVPGFGTTTEPKSYSFTDGDVTTGTYHYRLKQIDFDASFEYFNEVSVEVDFTPKDYTLYQNYPNPFNPATTIKYSLPYTSNVKIVIFNMLGEAVNELFNGVQDAGYYDIGWNAGSIASGIYFYSIQANSTDGQQEFQSVKKMLLLK